MLKYFKIEKIIAVLLMATLCFSFLPEPAAAAKKVAAPAKVKGVKVTKKTQNSIVIKWKKAKRAKKYQVYQYKVKKYIRIKTVKKCTITVKLLKPGRKYGFKIRGINGKKKGKFTTLKVTTKKATVKKPVNKTKNTAQSATPAAPGVAKDLNTPPTQQGSTAADYVPDDVNINGIRDYDDWGYYDKELNQNRFRVSIRIDDNKAQGLTFNAVDITPSKVKKFFGEFYAPGAVIIKKIGIEKFISGDGSKAAAEYEAFTDPFVSDVYLYATDKSGMVVYGKKIGWNYGSLKHSSKTAMFMGAKPQNDVFQKMYDKARARIVAKISQISQPGDTYKQRFDRYAKYVSNIILCKRGGTTYDITKYGKWVPGYVYGIGVGYNYRDNINRDVNAHDESTKIYQCNSNYKYMTIIGLVQSDCQRLHDLVHDDLIRDIDNNAKITYNLRNSNNWDHVDTGVSFSDGTGGVYSIMNMGDSTASTADVWDSRLKNNETCRQNFKDQVPNWQDWDIL